MTFSQLILSFCIFGFCGGADPDDQIPFQSESARNGFRLFNHRWQVGDELAGEGDGLGPLFNANSCDKCHPGGGASGLDQNVQLLTEKSKEHGARMSILHRQGTDPNYAQWRLSALGLKGNFDSQVRNKRYERYRLRQYQARPPVLKLPAERGRDVRLSERNTPALFGASLIDTVTLEDLRELESQQSRRNDDISGRVAMVDAHRPGRFGWRGQIATLRDFVLGACSNELGLQVKDHAQPSDPLNPEYQPPGNDLSFEQCQNLIDFVAGLQAPKRSPAESEHQSHLFGRGEQLMKEVHCSRCHSPSVGNVTGIFSDLLLHDMGPQLADPVPAKPQMVVAGMQQVSGGYFGTVSQEILEMAETNVHSEWRTPPLWGVADSAPYLHDGRAATLAEAIEMHGGEAANSRNMFLSLPAQDRRALLAFLRSLTSKDVALPTPAAETFDPMAQGSELGSAAAASGTSVALP